MKSFSYNGQAASGNAAQNVLSERKRSINRQQIIFIFIFVFLAFSLIVYAFQKMRYVNMDGFVQAATQDVNLMDDVFITNIHVSVGSHVNEGDTLFEFVLINGLTDRDNIIQTGWADKEYYVVKKRLSIIQSEMEILDMKVNLLQNDLARAQDLVFSGVKTESEISKIKNDLRSNQLNYDLLKNEYAIESEYGSFITDKRSTVHGQRLPSSLTISQIHTLPVITMSRHPYVAKYDGTVINIFLIDASYCYKAQRVMVIQPDNPKLLNLHVKAMVRPGDIELLKKGDLVEISIGSRHHSGVINFMGYQSQTIPKNLQKAFDRDIISILVRVDFKYPENLHFWEKTDGISAKIRKKRF